MADVTDTWKWWLYFGGFPDGIEVMKRGVRSVLIKRTAKFMQRGAQSISTKVVHASDVHLVVVDGTGIEWTLVPSKRKLLTSR